MHKDTRFIIINLISPRKNVIEGEQDLEELKSLVETFGGTKIVKVIQRRDYPDHHTYVGKGKAFDLQDMVKSEKIDVVVLNDIVKPSQIHSLQQVLLEGNDKVQVWDRVDLILYIFQKHANTAEAKLQIELAKMRHMGPRIYGMGKQLSQQGGGIGTVGAGETNTELMKRHWRSEVKQVQERLEKLAENHKKQLERRKRVGLKTVSIVGYTNAGKTSLFNLLSKKNNLVEDALFATLDSSVGKLYMPGLNQEVLLSDTIGFIQNLPASLIDAFKSTLMESVYADVLLHVVDCSDPRVNEKIEVVESILHQLNLDPKDQIIVFNKIDKLQSNAKELQQELKERYYMFYPTFISVHNKIGIEELIKNITSLIVKISNQPYV